MSQITKDINKITGTIIGISGKLILFALVVLLLAEGITRGYAFGHEIFYSTAMEPAPGRDKTLVVPSGQKPQETIHMLKNLGLIDNELAIQIQMRFYEYEIHPGTYTLNTSMTSKEILQKLNEEPEEEDAAEGARSGASGGNAGASGMDGGNLGAGGGPAADGQAPAQDEWPSEGEAGAGEVQVGSPEGGTQE